MLAITGKKRMGNMIKLKKVKAGVYYTENGQYKVTVRKRSWKPAEWTLWSVRWLEDGSSKIGRLFEEDSLTQLKARFKKELANG
jgi:hypothetical protein